MSERWEEGDLGGLADAVVAEGEACEGVGDFAKSHSDVVEEDATKVSGWSCQLERSKIGAGAEEFDQSGRGDYGLA